MSGVGRRSRRISTPHFLRGFGGRENPSSCVFLASSVTEGGTNEKQQIAVTGTPAGGNLTYTFRGVTSGNIAYNSTADAAETVLEAMSTIGAGNVRVTGGSLPGTPLVLEFIGDLGRQDLPLGTASGAGLTGGTSPAVAVTQTVAGSNTDAGYFVVKRGTIVMAAPGDATKTVAWDGASATTIKGLLLETRHFNGRDEIENTELTIVHGPGLDILAKWVPNYSLGSANFKTWAGTTGNFVTEGSV